MNRPKRLIAVVGTQTDVGKTWVSCELLRHWLRQGLRVAARKPVQSFSGPPTDAELLASTSNEEPHAVCPVHRWYEAAMAPPIAADVLGRARITLDDLVAETTWPCDVDVGLIETAGGVRSPVAHDGDSIDLVRRLQPDRVVLIADAGLGTINAIRLAMQCLADLPTVVFLNRFEPGNPLHAHNQRWLLPLNCEVSIDRLRDAL